MSGASIVIIGGGGNLRATVQAGKAGQVYTLLAGEGVQNIATSGPATLVIFRSGGVAYNWNLASGPGAVMASMFDGTVELA